MSSVNIALTIDFSTNSNQRSELYQKAYESKESYTIFRLTKRFQGKKEEILKTIGSRLLRRLKKFMNS